GDGDSSMSLERVLDDPKWKVVRRLPDRENRRLLDASGRAVVFAKYYPPRSAGESPSLTELAAIDLFQRRGILVNVPCAHAEDRAKGSLVAVKAARGEPLDDLL